MNNNVAAGLVVLIGAMMAMVGLMLTAFGFMLFASFLMSLPVYLLWNGCLVGAVAGVSTITWLQAWGLAMLSSMLFKSARNSEKKKD